MKRMLIAEVGSVHDGSFGNAMKLIEAAAECGSDAVKFQTHIAEAESLTDAPSPSYFRDESRIEYFKRTCFSLAQWKRLAAHSEKCGVIFLSSPFSLEAVDLLEDVGISIYKIPSGEVSNIPLLERIAKTKKPVLLSSGMSGWDELDDAVRVFKGSCDLVVMQCSSAYPCPPNAVGLNVLREMQARYQLPVGYSDHTMGMAAPIAAAALGATVIEKHFSFSQLMYGSDAKHSMEPREFAVLARSLKEIWDILDNPVIKSELDNYLDMKRIFEKSVVTRCEVKSGTVLSLEHLAFKKPGDGIKASRYKEIIGRRVRCDLPRDHKLCEEDF